MSSKKGGGKGSFSGTGAWNPSSKGKEIEGEGSAKNSPSIGQLSHAMADINVDNAEEGEWETAKKPRNRGGNAAKLWGSPSHVPKTWGHQEAASKTGIPTNGGTGKPHGRNWGQAIDPRKSSGIGNPKPQLGSKDHTYMAQSPAVPPPLQNGWQWAARSGTSSSQPKVTQGGSSRGYDSGSDSMPIDPDDASGDDYVEDSDDDLSDEYDSDMSQKSHETRKKNKWFRAFFEALDALSVEQINEPTRQWHCPACQHGPGAIDWYKGLQPLMTHAKTKGATRVKHHRELAKLLEEELKRKGTSVTPAGETFGKWRGLRETTADYEIVWPPMVVIRNTLLEQDENDKWIGMGNQELVEYFHPYTAVRARHSYGPQGHRGMSVLIFEATAMGYMEAERLHKHFVDEGRDRDAWEHRRVLFYPGGKRQLYGFLACKEDLDYFNQHSHGKSSRLKFEMKSYQEMVVGPMRQMSEDNQQLVWLKNKVVKQQQQSKTLEESLREVTHKLQETVEENRIVRLRSKEQHEENKEEMDQQEHFFKEQMEKVHRVTEEKERVFEKLLQEERAKVRQAYMGTGSKGEQGVR
ncbi:hypothetical protein Taro_021572 [Colocasia esculenta]|uniref:Uncharacterized protein n=1 Tax=Colocasia esculenta TaxID=4460 RepID=A0A843V5S5_COLES|nr:hypothetical protein [Colocasia esculenta]